MKSPCEIVQSLYKAFAKGDLQEVIGVLDPAVTWFEADGYPYAGTYTGPDAVRQGVFDRLAADWSVYTTIPEEFISQGDTVVALGQYSGTFRKTGKSFRAPFAHVFRVREGRIASFFQFTDTAVVQTALR